MSINRQLGRQLIRWLESERRIVIDSNTTRNERGEIEMESLEEGPEKDVAEITSMIDGLRGELAAARGVNGNRRTRGRTKA